MPRLRCQCRFCSGRSGLCLARTISARTRVRHAVHPLIVDLVCAGCRICLLRDFSTSREISARTRLGFPPAIKGRRLFRLHHHRHAGHGRRVPNAGDNLRPGPNRPRNGRIHGQNLENGSDRDSDHCRRFVSNQRHSEHDVVRGPDAGSLRSFDLHRVDFQQTPDDERKRLEITTGFRGF